MCYETTFYAVEFPLRLVESDVFGIALLRCGDTLDRQRHRQTSLTRALLIRHMQRQVDRGVMHGGMPLDKQHRASATSVLAWKTTTLLALQSAIIFCVSRIRLACW